MMKKLLTVLMTIAISLSAIAEAPSLINYQGKMTGLLVGSGQPRPQTSGDFMVRIFDQKTGGKLIYQEDIGVVTFNRDDVYSFAFGQDGHSILDFSESLIVQEDGKQVFDYTLSKVPVAGSLSIETGDYNWNEKTGSSDAGNLLVQYDKNNKSAKIIFLNGSPDKDTKFKFTYGIKENGIISALASSQNNWLELTFRQYFKGVQPARTFSPRERLLSVPFALEAKKLSSYPAFGKRIKLPAETDVKIEHDGFVTVTSKGGGAVVVDGEPTWHLGRARDGHTFTLTIPVRKNSIIRIAKGWGGNPDGYFMPILFPGEQE
jgi:hypothetical protein